MTRKDYQLIAGVIAHAVTQCDPESEVLSAISLVVDRLCFALESDNPRFDRGTFYKACGLVDT